jgi:hypothetical protein
MAQNIGPELIMITSINPKLIGYMNFKANESISGVGFLIKIT